MAAEKLGTLRIIGGQWRSRKIIFPAVEGLRPSADRIRETLFNWLNLTIEGSVCLDLFAGSGALGLEALSRGAKEVIFLEQDPKIIAHIEKYLALLDANQKAKVLRAYVPKTALRLKAKADIVFIDPPFNQGLVEITCAWLEEQDLLAPDALIYIEAERSLNPLPVPKTWELYRSKKAGNVGYHLLKRNPESSL
jgi:16S rRNA (guanine966-N2)-methyltransferase